MQSFPPAIVDEIKATNGLRGFMISSARLPQSLVGNRKQMCREIERVRRLVENMCENSSQKIVIGLGGWWPSFTMMGLLVETLMDKHKYLVTTGHTATVLSIIKTVKKLIKKSGVAASTAQIAVVGCGNIGTAVSEALVRDYAHITLIDLNEKKSEKLRDMLIAINPRAKIEIVGVDKALTKAALSKCHLGVCATSNASLLFDKRDIDKHFVFIDDSRPEAIPRFEAGDERYTLEGGLIKVENMVLNCDVGFGLDGRNTLGCLSEAYMLALDSSKNKVLHNTIGRVTHDMLARMDAFIEQDPMLDIGDYKMGDQYLDAETIANSMRIRAGAMAFA
jgi:predicted amino acid dehydrogenase